MVRQKIYAWIMATRPQSLIMSVVPIAMGTALAFTDGLEHWRAAACALCAAVLVHVGTNLTNDYCDFKRGADRIGHTDPMRGIAIGSVSQATIKYVAIGSFVLALVPWFFLVKRGGAPLFTISIASFCAGIFYTAGKRPLGYQGWGDILVCIFFGPVAVAGTYYVQALEINTAVILAGFSPGLFAMAVLTINNIRDSERDRRVGKNTLAVRFGRVFAEYEYFTAITLACVMPICVYFITKNYYFSLVAVMTLVVAYRPIKAVLSSSSDEATLNRAIGWTMELCMLYGALFSAGWICSI